MTTSDVRGSALHGPGALVSTYLTAEVVTVAPTASVRDAAATMAGAGVSALVIGAVDDVEAVVSERDIVRAVAEGLDVDRVAVADIGSRDLVWADADDTIGEAAEEMMEDYVRHVLVRDEGGLAGVLSMRDALSAFLT